MPGIYHVPSFWGRVTPLSSERFYLTMTWYKDVRWEASPDSPGLSLLELIWKGETWLWCLPYSGLCGPLHPLSGTPVWLLTGTVASLLLDLTLIPHSKVHSSLWFSRRKYGWPYVVTPAYGLITLKAVSGRFRQDEGWSHSITQLKS